MVAITIYLGLAAAGLIFAYFRLIYRIRRQGEPPYVKGHFLWGNGAEFSEHAVRFLHKSQKKLGDIFTIRLLNQYLTIIMDPHAYEAFAKEKRFDFDPIQKQVNNNVFSFSLKNAHKMISEAGKKVNGKYLSNNMQNFSKNLQESIQNIASASKSDQPKADSEWQTEGLRTLMSRTLFSALFYTIFGRSNGPDRAEEVKGFNPQAFHENFDVFHMFFNYLWLGLPAKLFPKACEALQGLFQQPLAQDMLPRDGISDYIKFSTEFMLKQEQSEQDIMAHNLVFLHVNYNSFRLTYWCVYLMMEHPETHEALARELREEIEAKHMDAEHRVGFTMDEIDKLPVLDSFMKETLRVASGVFMVRYVAEDTDFQMPSGQTYRVRKGDRVAMYPPTTHMDTEIFENPETFKYDRFVNATFYKHGKELKHPIQTFGSLCPGKRIAMLEMKWFMMNLINSFSLELPAGERTVPNTAFYGHEILPPVNDVKVNFQLKADAPQIVFIPRRSPRS